MKKRMTILSTLLVVVMIAGTAMAYGPGRGMRGSGWGQGGGNPDCPGYGNQQATQLTEEQKTQLDALRQAHIDSTYELRTSKLQKDGELRLLLKTSNPDQNKITALVNEISDLNANLMKERINFQLEARKIAPELQFGGMGGGFRQHRFGNRGGCQGWNGQGAVTN